MRTLAKEPKDRPASAEILAGELLAALEAHGAQTSGVRASITNAAGIRVPESMRPPPMALPKPLSRSRFPLFLLAVPLVLVAAAGGVYLGMARRAQVTSTTTGTGAGTSTAAATTTATVEFGANPTNATATAEPPTVTPDSLPRAASTTTAVTGAVASGKHGKTPPPGKPVKGGPTGRPTGPASPTPSPSSTTGYGIFE